MRTSTASAPAHRHLGLLATVVLLAFAAGGCSAIAERLAVDLAGRRGSAVDRDLTVLHADAAEYRQCLERRGGACPAAAAAAATAPAAPAPRPLTTALPPSIASSMEQRFPAGSADRLAVDSARAVLEHPVQQQLNGLFNQLRGCAAGTASSVTVSASDLQDYADAVHRAVSMQGFERLAEQGEEVARRLEARSAAGDATVSAAERRAVAEHVRTSRFLAVYLAAYFENGHFFQLDLDLANLENDLRARLREKYPLLCGGDDSGNGPGGGGEAAVDEAAGDLAAAGDPGGAAPVTCDEVVQVLIDEIFRGAATDPATGAYVFGRIPASGYVSRTGLGFRFPGLVVTLDPADGGSATLTKIDYRQVAVDLVRVSLEAIFDAHEGLPAVSNATGTQLGEAWKADALPVFSAAAGDALSAQDFGAVNELSDRTEATTGAIVGRLVRGAGPLALNNEALADVLTTAVAVTVAKAGEKAAWCYYSCGFDRDVKAAGHQLGADLRRATLRLVP